MKRIPLAYSLRNLWARRLTTALTAGGMALVVFVFAAVLMLDQGLKEALVDTGQADNVVVIRKGSETEVQSIIERNQAALLETLPQVALAAGGLPQVSKETVVLITLPKHGGKPANGYVTGFGEKLRGAIGSSVGHDSHNLVVVGTDIVYATTNGAVRTVPLSGAKPKSLGGIPDQVIGLAVTSSCVFVLNDQGDLYGVAR